MLTKGSIVNEFGEVVGRYWWREGQNTISVSWLGVFTDGWTDEGLAKWATHLEYNLIED